MAIFALNQYLQNVFEEQPDSDEIRLESKDRTFSLFSAYLENYDDNYHLYHLLNNTMLFLIKGEAIVSLDDKNLRLKAGNILFIKKDMKYGIKSSNKAILVKLKFNGSFDFNKLIGELHPQNNKEEVIRDGLLNSLAKEGCIWFKNTAVMPANQLLQKVLIEYLNDDLFTQDIIKADLILALILSLRSVKFVSINGMNKTKFDSNSLDNYLRAHYAHVDLKQAAEYFGFNQNYFSNLVKRETGRTFVKHLDAIRMQVARELLAEPDISLKEIVKRVGYSSRSFFYKKFQQYYHTTPAIMRQELFRQANINLK